MPPRSSSNKEARPRPRRTTTPAPAKPLFGGGSASARPAGYWALSTRPLHVLLFLTPLVLFYELGSFLYLDASTEGARQMILAQKLLGEFFQLFGAAGLFLPGIALITVLLIWHVLLGDRWKVRPGVLGGMTLESLAWTMPLLVLAAVYSGAAERMAMPAMAAPPGGDLYSLRWEARLTVAIGAGLYEEMLFRLVLIALLHLVFADLLRLHSTAAAAVAVAGAAIAFGLYHDVTLPTGGTNWPKLLFLTAAGAYLGTVYMLRGFGIVAGTHAVYDIMVLVLLRSD